MRAVQATAFGGPEVLVTSEVPDLVAGPGQVVIDVAVADTLFLDTQLRRGWGGEYFTVAPGGRFSAHGAPSGVFTEIDPQEAQRKGVTVRGIDDVQFAPADRKLLTARALSEAAAGRLRPIIGQTFRLQEAA
jgi:NADPH:quinone reductase-like Zn-dependent oxidoreductase